MTTFPSAIAVLSAMITPAVLIVACGSLIVATSARLGRVIDRTRALSVDFAELASAEPGAAGLAEEQALLFDQLGKATSRARLLQRAMTRLYLALSGFVATSVAIGIVSATGREHAWVLVVLGLAGAGLLFNASVLLIMESRVALAAIDDEMDYLVRSGERAAPEALVAASSRRSLRARLRRRKR